MKIGLALFEFIQSVYNPNDNQMLVSSNINESRYSELPYIFLHPIHISTILWSLSVHLTKDLCFSPLEKEKENNQQMNAKEE